MTYELTQGTLFSGVGGAEIAGDRVGIKTLFSVENDPHASKVLAHHYPEIPNYGDIKSLCLEASVPATERPRRKWVGGGRVHPDRRGAPRVGHTTDHLQRTRHDHPLPAPDILIGGFPCQSYSVAGNRGGLAEDRGALWWDYHRLIRTLRPAWVVGENVPGLLSSRGGKDFQTIIRSLTQFGYGVVWAVLDAQYFGVAQRRRRVFIVGHLGGIPRPEVLALGEGLCGYPQPRREARKDLAPTITARSKGGGGLGTDFEVGGGLVASPSSHANYEIGKVAETIRQQSYKHSMPLVVNARQDPVVSEGITGSLDTDGQSNGVLTTYPIYGDRPAFANQNGRGVGNEDDPMFTLTKQGRHSVAIDLLNQRETGDVHAPLRTATGHGAPAVMEFPAVRRLTPLETERLQGFPDNWTLVPGNSDTQRYRQMGNAFPVPVVEWILGNLVKADRELRARGWTHPDE